MVGSEVYSAEVKKTEVLMENFRRAIGIYFPNTYSISGFCTLLTLNLPLWNNYARVSSNSLINQ